MRPSICRSRAKSLRSSARTAPARPICWRRCRCSRPAAACAAPISPTWRARTGAAASPPRSRWRMTARGSASGCRRADARGHARSRIARIDGAPAGSALAFSEHLRVVWLTPDLDGLFRGSAGERRRFLDRLVLAVDPAHAARSNALERALRSRNRILEETPRPGAMARRGRARDRRTRRRGRGRAGRDGGAALGDHRRDARRRLALSPGRAGAGGRDRHAGRRSAGARRRGRPIAPLLRQSRPRDRRPGAP